MFVDRVLRHWVDDGDLVYPTQRDAVTATKSLVATVLPDLARGASVLVTDCGSAYMATALQELGLVVSGMDLAKRPVRRPECVPDEQESGRFDESGDFSAFVDVKYACVFAFSNILTALPGEEAQIDCIRGMRSLVDNENGVAVFGLHDYGTLMQVEADDAVSKVFLYGGGSVPAYVFSRRHWTGTPRQARHQCFYHFVSRDAATRADVIEMRRFAIAPRRLTQILRDCGFAEVQWYSPYDVGYHQHVCVAYAKRRRLPPVNVAIDAEGRIKPKCYVLWDGEVAQVPEMMRLLADPSVHTAVHYTQILDTVQMRREGCKKRSDAQQAIDKLEKEFPGSEFTWSLVDRSELSDGCPRSVVQAYLAAQVMMSANLTRNDRIVVLPKPENISLCLEMVKAVARREEDIPSIA